MAWHDLHTLVRLSLFTRAELIAVLVCRYSCPLGSVWALRHSEDGYSEERIRKALLGYAPPVPTPKFAPPKPAARAGVTWKQAIWAWSFFLVLLTGPAKIKDTLKAHVHIWPLVIYSVSFFLMHRWRAPLTKAGCRSRIINGIKPRV